MNGTDPRLVHAIDRVTRAVTERGPAEGVHQRQIVRLAQEWRPLARALGELMAAQGLTPPKEWR